MARPFPAMTTRLPSWLIATPTPLSSTSEGGWYRAAHRFEPSVIENAIATASVVASTFPPLPTTTAVELSGLMVTAEPRSALFALPPHRVDHFFTPVVVS